MIISGTGIANKSKEGELLDVYFSSIKFNDREISQNIYHNQNTSHEIVEMSWSEEDLDRSIENISDAYFKLHLLSHKFALPNTLNLDGLFDCIPNVAWTNYGPVSLNDIDEKLEESKKSDNNLYIKSLDKFPCLTDYIVPKKVRIADTRRVRLGAYLSEGTTVMHEGFVNFNAGTLGTAMIEGRISAGVVIGNNSDLGGGSSTMGTLSGGNNDVISVGENCLVGANAGIGISLGDNCIVEAGLYITSGTKIHLMEGDIIKDVVKAKDISGSSNMLFLRDSTSGKVISKNNKKESILNTQLHKND